MDEAAFPLLRRPGFLLHQARCLVRGLLGLQLPARVPERVDTKLGDARPAVQVAVERRLDPRLPDLVAGLVPCGGVLQLLLGDLAHIAEQLRRDVPVRVVAEVGGGDLHARKLVPVLSDVADLGLVHPDFDRDRRQRIALSLVDSVPHLSDRDVDDLRQQLQLTVARIPGLRQVGGIELDRSAADVVHEHFSVAVEDLAARRLQPYRAQLVVLSNP